MLRWWLKSDNKINREFWSVSHCQRRCFMLHTTKRKLVSGKTHGSDSRQKHSYFCFPNSIDGMKSICKTFFLDHTWVLKEQWHGFAHHTVVYIGKHFNAMQNTFIKKLSPNNFVIILVGLWCLAIFDSHVCVVELPHLTWRKRIRPHYVICCFTVLGELKLITVN